jgi:hypothetical protein
LGTDAEENIWTQENEIAGGWRKQHNEELHDLYLSLNRVVKPRRMKRTGLAAKTEET